MKTNYGSQDQQYYIPRIPRDGRLPTTGKPMGVVTTPRNGGQANLKVPDGATDI
ncbi:MAG: hypothetical protein LUO80_09755 [Methylococcaceae bacterium]|nr:hypothetical protein [Methylococcaceae bacterium]